MKRLAVLLLLGFASLSSAQQAASPHKTVLWGHNGVPTPLATTADNDWYICKPVEAVRSALPITVSLIDGHARGPVGTAPFSWATDVTGVIIPPGGVGGDYTALGIRARVAGKDYIWYVSARVDPNDIEVRRGGALLGAPEAGTLVTDWSYWVSPCRRYEGSGSIYPTLTWDQIQRMATPIDGLGTQPQYFNTLSPMILWSLEAALSGNIVERSYVFVVQPFFPPLLQEATVGGATRYFVSVSSKSGVKDRVLTPNDPTTLDAHAWAAAAGGSLLTMFALQSDPTTPGVDTGYPVLFLTTSGTVGR